MISKYGLSNSKAVGPLDPSFLVVKKSHFDKKYSSYSESTNSTKQKVHVGSQCSKTCLKQPLKKDKTKILNTCRAAVDGTPSQIPAFLPITFTYGSRSHKM